MQTFKIALICVIPLAFELPAQIGPTWVDQDSTTPGLQTYHLSEYFTRKAATGTKKSMGDITSPAAIWTSTSTAAAMFQVSLGKQGIGGLATGEFHMCLTTTNLNAAYGGKVSGQQVFMGKVTWNSGDPVFTPNMMANSMNTSGNVFGLMIDDKDGKVAAVDWPSGAVVAWRKDNTVAYGTPVLVTGISGKYVDPAPGYVNGELVLFWVDHPTLPGRLVYAPLILTITNGTLTAASVNTAKKVVVVDIPGRFSHSPTPISDKSGNCLGMWYASRVGGNSDMYFTANIHKPTHFLGWDNGTSWVNNGGVAGGRFLAASNNTDGFYGRLMVGEAFYLVSNSEIAVGPTAMLTLAAGGPSSKIVPIVTTTVVLSFATATPLPLPGVGGALALDIRLLFYPVGGGITSVTRDDFAQMQLPAAVASLKGVSVSFQALMNPVGTSPSFSSTCTASFK